MVVTTVTWTTATTSSSSLLLAGAVVASMIRTTGTWVVATVTTICEVGRGGEALLSVRLDAVAHVVGAELPEELVERDVGIAVDGGNEGAVVVFFEAAEKMPDQLVVLEWLAHRSELGGEPLHLGEVLVGGEGQLFGVVELCLKVLNLGASSGLEHVVNCRPSLGSSFYAKDMRKDIRR